MLNHVFLNLVALHCRQWFLWKVFHFSWVSRFQGNAFATEIFCRFDFWLCLTQLLNIMFQLSIISCWTLCFNCQLSAVEYYVSYQLTPSPPSIPVSVVIQIQIGFGILRPLQFRVGFIKTVAYGNVSPNPIYPSKGRVTLPKWMDFRKSSSFHSFSFLSTLTSSMYSQQIRVQPVWITIYHLRFSLIKQSFFLFHHSSMRSLIQLINSRATRGITG